MKPAKTQWTGAPIRVYPTDAVQAGDRLWNEDFPGHGILERFRRRGSKCPLLAISGHAERCARTSALPPTADVIGYVAGCPLVTRSGDSRSPSAAHLAALEQGFTSEGGCFVPMPHMRRRWVAARRMCRAKTDVKDRATRYCSLAPARPSGKPCRGVVQTHLLAGSTSARVPSHQACPAAAVNLPR